MPPKLWRVPCSAPHTTYQPDDDQWHCPKCGEATPGEFFIDELAPDANQDCDRLHPDDECCCATCHWEGSGKTVARLLMHAENLMPCPHCKGAGVVPKEVEA